MEFEFQTNKKDFRNFYYKVFSKRLLLNIFIIVPISLFVSLCVFPIQTNLTECIYIFVITLLGLFVLSHLTPKLIRIKRLAKGINKIENRYDKIKLSLSDNGLDIGFQSRHDFYTWKEITSVKFMFGSVNLILQDNKLLVVPKRFFTTTEEIENLINAVRLKLNK